MKRRFVLIGVALLLALITLYLIPTEVERQVFIPNTYQNLLASVSSPTRWSAWNPEVHNALRRYPKRVLLSHDSAGKILSAALPGKTISVTELTYLLYRFEENTGDKSSVFTMQITPFVGNGQPRSQHNTMVAYAAPTRMLFRLMPFLAGDEFPNRTVSALKSYLEDNKRFYGFPIAIAPDSSLFFLTKKQVVPNRDLFPTLNTIFHDIDNMASELGCSAGSRNVYFSLPRKDSVEILAGVNINKVVEGKEGFGFMQLPEGQILLTAEYEGKFDGRSTLYDAMDKYLLDHELVKSGAVFERYLSPLPVSGQSVVHFRLCYPLRYQ